MFEIIKRFLTKNPIYQRNLARNDQRYVEFQAKKPRGLLLHSVGCPQPSAEVFANKWDNPTTELCVHAFIDANTGTVLQTLPWNYRGAHAGVPANDLYIGVEMCESNAIRYVDGVHFDVLDEKKAKKHCKTTYDSAVDLFAYLCKELKLDPIKDILSHREAGKAGIASGHLDPDHYWSGLNMGYTMDGFRQAVKEKMEQAEEASKQQEKEKAAQAIKFSDVAENRFYADAVAWAAENGIVNGRGGERFEPNEPATRGEIATMLYRFYKMMKNGG